MPISTRLRPGVCEGCMGSPFLLITKPIGKVLCKTFLFHGSNDPLHVDLTFAISLVCSTSSAEISLPLVTAGEYNCPCTKPTASVKTKPQTSKTTSPARSLEIDSQFSVRYLSLTRSAQASDTKDTLARLRYCGACRMHDHVHALARRLDGLSIKTLKQSITHSWQRYLEKQIGMAALKVSRSGQRINGLSLMSIL